MRRNNMMAHRLAPRVFIRGAVFVSIDPAQEKATPAALLMSISLGSLTRAWATLLLSTIPW